MDCVTWSCLHEADTTATAFSGTVLVLAASACESRIISKLLVMLGVENHIIGCGILHASCRLWIFYFMGSPDKWTKWWKKFLYDSQLAVSFCQGVVKTDNVPLIPFSSSLNEQASIPREKLLWHILSCLLFPHNLEVSEFTVLMDGLLSPVKMKVLTALSLCLSLWELTSTQPPGRGDFPHVPFHDGIHTGTWWRTLLFWCCPVFTFLQWGRTHSMQNS